jgi:hypothetical protein
MSSERPSTADLVGQLNDALETLASTEATLEARRADENAAARATTDARNAHNDAQKKVDTLIAALRDTRHGDWSFTRNLPARLGGADAFGNPGDGA